MNDVALWSIAIVGGYLLGSVPFGLVIGLAFGVDPRTKYSGNIGATNVWRSVGPIGGLLCFALDFFKGCAPPLFAGLASGALTGEHLTHVSAWLWLSSAAAPIVGHIYPIWLRFRGGKGVATSFGALAALWPLVTFSVVAAFVAWVLVVRLMRNVGLASSVAAVVLPIAYVAGVFAIPGGRDGPMLPFLVVLVSLSTLALWRHRRNLADTFSGRHPSQINRTPEKQASRKPSIEKEQTQDLGKEGKQR